MKLTLVFAVTLLALCLSGIGGTLPNVHSVTISNTRNDWFYVEELEVLNADGIDVASLAFGTLIESSEEPAFGGITEGAIDDVIEGACCTGGFHSSTGTGGQSFTLTFPAPQTITGEIRLWNRQDGCCSERLDGMLFEYFSGENGAGDLIGAQEVIELAINSADISTELGAAFEVTNPDSDSDGDGLTNRFETDHDLDPDDAAGDNGAEGDPDEDGSTNMEEFVRETHPQIADTDEDGLLDGVETGTGVWVDATDTGTDPLKADSDGDTLLDGVETLTGTLVDSSDTGTHPLLVDSDSDGFQDEREIGLGTDPNDAESKPVRTIAVPGVRSVRITNTQIGWFYLEELDLRNVADVDVASVDFGTTATSSEFPGFGGSAEGPIDDTFGNCCATGYHSSTEEGEQTLTFTFPTPQDLSGEIRVWNRQDGCCAERLDAMLFEYFSGEDGTGELIADQLVEGVGTEQLDEVNSPTGAAVPLVEVAPTGPLFVTVITRSEPDAVILGWASKPGNFFAIDQSQDLRLWEERLALAAAATEGEETFLLLGGVSQSPSNFFRVRRTSAPAFLEEDFEGDAAEWLTGVSESPFPNEGTTTFELGKPTTGPGSAHGGDQAYATGLASNYDDNLNIVLTSPVVDLTGQRRATLTFWYFLESGNSEGARLEIIDADDPSQTLAQTDVFDQADVWTLVEFDLGKFGTSAISVLGQRVRLRFQFLSDGTSADNGAGFYLDDVLVDK